VEGFGYPNFFSYLAFYAWFPLSLIAFFVTKKPLRTALAVYLGGLLFLPERIDFDLPLVPPIGKGEIAALSCFVGSVLKLRKRIFKLPPGRGVELFIPVIVLAALVTASQNSEPLVIGWKGDVVLPGHDMVEGVGLGIREVLQIGLPFYLGRLLFRDEEDLKLLITGFTVAAVIYIPFLLFEIRFSPQLHALLYGFHQHFFGQTVRWGGFRPMVFLEHGLAVAMFVLAGTIAAFSAAKAGLKVFKRKGWLIAHSLFVMLVLCKSTGAIIMGLLCLPLVKFGRLSKQLQLVTILSMLIVIYPGLKIMGQFPKDAIVDTARSLFGEERGQSIEFRFENDEILVERAAQKLWFGWGGYGRGRVYDYEGKDISVTDGYWIIQLGNRGLIGLYGNLGLIVVPLLVARRRLRRVKDKQHRTLLTGLALMVAMYGADLLPNGLYNSAPFLLAGALVTLSAELSKRSATQPATTMQAELPHAA
jgi:hypothetical protein